MCDGYYFFLAKCLLLLVVWFVFISFSYGIHKETHSTYKMRLHAPNYYGKLFLKAQAMARRSLQWTPNAWRNSFPLVIAKWRGAVACLLARCPRYTSTAPTQLHIAGFTEPCPTCRAEFSFIIFHFDHFSFWESAGETNRNEFLVAFRRLWAHLFWPQQPKNELQNWWLRWRKFRDDMTCVCHLCRTHAAVLMIRATHTL